MKSHIDIMFIFFVTNIGTLAVLAMEPFPGYRFKEIKFEGGKAGATSIHKNWIPDNAFKPNQPLNNGWHVGPTTGTADNFPVMVWYQLPEPILTAEVSLQPAQTGAGLQGAPSSYQFVGTNDPVCNDRSQWTVLCEDLRDKAWRSYWEVRYCRTKPEITEKFKCLGIRALKNHRADGWTSIRNIRVWEKILIENDTQEPSTKKEDL